MLLWFLRFFIGYVTVLVEGERSERFLNLCAVRGINFWDLTNSPGGTRFKINASNFSRLREIAAKSGCKVSVVKKFGIPFFLSKHKKRSVLLVGAFAFLAGLYILSGFVWSIEVTGNEKITSDQVIYALQKNGFETGVASSGINIDELCERMKIELPELIWIAINIRGSKAEVSLRERDEKPEIMDIATPSDIVAAKDGVIIRSEVADGVNVAVAGDTVKEGDLIVSGVIISEKGGRRLTAARGKVFAKTSIKVSSTAPSSYTENIYTGEEAVRYTLKIFSHSIKLFFDGSIAYENYDKIAGINELHLGDIYFPIAIISERFLECVPTVRELDYEQQLAICRKQRDELFAAYYPDIEVEEIYEDVERLEGGLKLISDFRCIEDIAKRAPIVL